MDPLMFVLRILIPLSIFRFPLGGGLVSMWLDGMDWGTNFFHLSNLHNHYSEIDKLLDIYYLTIEVYVVSKWKDNLAKKIAYFLYFDRAIGVFLFIWSRLSFFLVLFPNIFEGFFLFYMTVRFLLGAKSRIPKMLLWLSVIVLGFPKLVQEYVMHFWENSDWRFVQIKWGPFDFRYDNIGVQIGMIVGLILGTVFLSRQKKRFNS